MLSGDRPHIGILGPAHASLLETLSSYPAFVPSDASGRPPAEQAKYIRALATSGEYGRLDAATLDLFPNIEFLASFGVGYEYIDLDAVKARGIVVSNTPGVLNEEVADTAFGLLLNAVRKFPAAEAFVRDGLWAQGNFPLTDSLRNRTLGVLGLGRIGIAIARRAEAFGLAVAYHNRAARKDVAYQYCASALELARVCDILVCVLPGGATTRHAVNAEIFAALGARGVFVSVGRGSCVDQQALIAALEERTILAAALDVFEDEPNAPLALRASPHVALSPHIGSATHATRAAMARLVIDNLLSYANGAGPLTPIPETPWRGA